MKRTATIVGIAAALAVPAVASAGSNPEVVAQVKPQLKTQVVTQSVKAQVAKRQIARAHRVSAARARALAKVRIPELGGGTISPAAKPESKTSLCKGTLVSHGRLDGYGLELYTWSTCGNGGGLPFG